MKNPLLFSAVGLAALGTIVWFNPRPTEISASKNQAAVTPLERSHLPSRNASVSDGSTGRKSKTAKRPGLKERLEMFTAFASGGMEPHERELALQQWLEAIDGREIQGALDFLAKSSIDAELVADATGRLMRRWTELDSETAAVFLTRMPEGRAREQAVENFSIVRSNQDLAAASGWAKALPEGAERDQALFAIANEAARISPLDSLRLSSNLPATPVADELIRRAAMEWGMVDPAAAVAWTRGIEGDEALSEKVLSGVALSWADQDPSAAAGLVINGLSTGRAQCDAAIGVFQRWSQADPGAAMKWVSSLPDGDLKSNLETNDVVLQVAKVREN